LEKNPQTARHTKTKKTQFLRAKTEKPNQKLAKSAKPKTPMPPSMIGRYQGRNLIVDEIEMLAMLLRNEIADIIQDEFAREINNLVK